ncbi:virulence-associated V antigen [Aeromonas hydrophila]|uniref:virulence-associated V antigen n=1 Tax=Aeromonas hydrophila TaxID=644 RepID=UPI001FC7C565|nr:virulence-associated V antigen [Aeromonas hydrophila]GKQ99029.1 virulence-associated V antigen [Aeromonas hydrophila]
MEISSYKKDPQLFLSDLGKVELNQLQGGSSSSLDELVKLIKDKKIVITATHDPKIDGKYFDSQVVTDNEALFKKVLAYFMPADSKNPGGQYDLQIKAGFEQLHKLINEAAAAGKTKFTLREFLAATHFSLTPDRIDDDVIGAMLDAMGSHSSKRDTLKHEVGKLTAELRSYSIIQTEISTAQQHNGTVEVGRKGANIFDYQHYGYDSHEAFAKKDANGQYNPQYQLLKEIAIERKEAMLVSGNGDIDKIVGYEASELGITSEQYRAKLRNELSDLKSDKPVFLSARDFLTSSKKDTGALSNVHHSYKYEKDNNPLSNFATTVGDRAKPLNDKLGQKTTELNDISSRYNSVIEALNRFIQKYESVMQQILQAI